MSLVHQTALYHRAYETMRAASQSSSNNKLKPDPVTPVRSSGANQSRNTSYTYGTTSSASAGNAFYPGDQAVRRSTEALHLVSSMNLSLMRKINTPPIWYVMIAF